MSRTAALIVVVALSVGMARSGVAETRTATIAAVLFRPTNDGIKHFAELGGLGRLCLGGGTGYFVAPLNIPFNARVTALRAFVADADADAFALLSLFETRQGQPHLLAMAGPSVGTSKPAQIEELSTTTIEGHGDGALYLHLMLSGPNVCLQQAVVEFELP